jgi:protein-arginine kinase activator protein McsA
MGVGNDLFDLVSHVLREFDKPESDQRPNKPDEVDCPECGRTFKRKTGEAEVICPKCYHCFKPMT